jgi:chemotaxis protein methyltransferase CheR
MPNPTPDALLSQVADFVAAKLGLYFSRERWHDLERGIASAARDLGFPSVESCIHRLISLPLEKAQLEVLASHITVGETYFFREKNTFAALEEHVFPDLIRSRRPDQRRLRIWSAGCATGEEPYSIAILLRKLIPDLPDWNVTILATDINPSFLQKAFHGVYSEWSFRDTPLWLKERYFKRRQEGRYEILPEIRKMVTFSYLNLAEDSYPSLLNNTNAMDLILCRNVLMYFAPERAGTTIQKFHDSLVPGGWLIVSPSEASHVLFSRFMMVRLREAILYEKDPGQGRGEAHGSRAMEVANVVLHSPAEAIAKPAAEVSSSAAAEETARGRDGASTTEVTERKSDESPSTLYTEAFQLYEHGHYEKAIEKLSLCLPDKGDHTNAMALLARLYANRGKLAEALEWCKKALAGDRLNPALHFLEGMVLQEQGIIEDAMASLKRALYLDQNFALAHFALGSLASRQGRLVESNKHFENALSILSAHRPEEILPESDGLTAGRLIEIISSARAQGSNPESP